MKTNSDNGKCEEEIPVNAILCNMFMVVSAFDSQQSTETQKPQWSCRHQRFCNSRNSSCTYSTLQIHHTRDHYFKTH